MLAGQKASSLTPSRAGIAATSATPSGERATTSAASSSVTPRPQTWSSPANSTSLGESTEERARSSFVTTSRSARSQSWMSPTTRTTMDSSETTRSSFHANSATPDNRPQTWSSSMQRRLHTFVQHTSGSTPMSMAAPTSTPGRTKEEEFSPKVMSTPVGGVRNPSSSRQTPSFPFQHDRERLEQGRSTDSAMVKHTLRETNTSDNRLDNPASPATRETNPDSQTGTLRSQLNSTSRSADSHLSSSSHAQPSRSQYKPPGVLSLYASTLTSPETRSDPIEQKDPALSPRSMQSAAASVHTPAQNEHVKAGQSPGDTAPKQPRTVEPPKVDRSERPKHSSAKTAVDRKPIAASFDRTQSVGSSQGQTTTATPAKALQAQQKEKLFMSAAQAQRERVQRIRKAMRAAEVIQQAWRTYRRRKARM